MNETKLTMAQSKLHLKTIYLGIIAAIVLLHYCYVIYYESSSYTYLLASTYRLTTTILWKTTTVHFCLCPRGYNVYKYVYNRICIVYKLNETKQKEKNNVFGRTVLFLLRFGE